MKKIFILISIMILLTCSGCGNGLILDEAVPKAPQNGITRSIYIYMSGGDAEADYGSATQALREMTKVDFPENMNVIVQTGGTSKWQEEGFSSDKLDRFEVRHGGLYKAESVDNENMGTSKTLIDFLNWGKEKYPADSNILIIWGQGGGCTGGVAYDSRYSYDSLTPGEIAYAMSRSGMSYDLVGFDACMMSNLETASAMAPYASFMAASEEYQPCSWDYRTWLQYIVDNPEASADKIGVKICESYYNKCVDIKQDDFASIAVTDLSEISALTQAFDGLAGNLNTLPDSLDKYKNYALAMENIHLIGGKTVEEGYSNMIDLDDFAKLCSQNADYNYDTIDTTIQKAVIYKACGMLVPHNSGIGIFYPIRRNADELRKYFDITPSSNYADFLRNICAVPLDDGKTGYSSSKAWSSYLNEDAYFKYAAKIDSNCYELNISGNMDIVTNVVLKLYKKDKSENYLYLDSNNGMDIDRNAGIYRDNGDKSCLTLNGHTVTSYLIDKGADFLLYSIPSYKDNVAGSIRAAVITQNGKQKTKVYGFWKGINVNYGMSDRNMSKIGFWDKLQPFSIAYNSGGDYYKTDDFRAFGMSIKNKPLPDGEYKIEYVIKDIYGREITADPSLMTIIDGNAEKK